MTKRVLSFVLLAVMLVTLAACSTPSLSGTYTDESGAVSYIFSGVKVSMSAGGDEPFEIGEFEIRDGSVHINGTPAGTVKGNTVTLYGVEFTKE
jgi:hypothetical protein